MGSECCQAAKMAGWGSQETCPMTAVEAAASTESETEAHVEFFEFRCSPATNCQQPPSIRNRIAGP